MQDKKSLLPFLSLFFSSCGVNKLPYIFLSMTSYEISHQVEIEKEKYELI